MRYDITLITTGLLCLLVGEGVGIWMGINQDFTFAPAHAHLNLVGWVTLTLFGLAHRAYPTLAKSRLALVQAAISIISNIVLPAGIAYAIAAEQPIIAIIASNGVVLGTLLFAIMFVRHARKA